MSSRRATAAAVAALYTAAGRNYADAELVLYHDALADVADDELARASSHLVRTVDLAARPPSPALVIQTVVALRRYRALRTPALTAGDERPAREDALNHVRALREAIRGEA